MRERDAADQIGAASCPERSGLFSPLLSMRSLLLFSLLSVTGLSAGVAAGSYGQRISLAPSLQAAAPFAAPFALLSFSSAAALALAGVALSDREAL